MLAPAAEHVRDIRLAPSCPSLGVSLRYTKGAQHQVTGGAASRKRVAKATSDTSVFLLRTDAARKRWPASAAAKQAIKTAFAGSTAAGARPATAARGAGGGAGASAGEAPVEEVRSKRKRQRRS